MAKQTNKEVKTETLVEEVVESVVEVIDEITTPIQKDEKIVQKEDKKTQKTETIEEVKEIISETKTVESESFGEEVWNILSMSFNKTGHWEKSTKVLNVQGGCVIYVSTKNKDLISDSLVFVPHNTFKDGKIVGL